MKRIYKYRGFNVTVELEPVCGGQLPFSSEAEALMAGFSASQRVINDTLVE